MDYLCDPADSVAVGVGVPRSRFFDSFAAGDCFNCGGDQSGVREKGDLIARDRS